MISFRYCRWCHGRPHGCLYCDKEREKYEEDLLKPLFTARTDNPAEMEELKKVVGGPALELAFGPGGNGMVDVVTNAFIQTINRHQREAQEKEEKEKKAQKPKKRKK